VTLGNALAGDVAELDGAFAPVMMLVALLPAERRRCANAIMEFDFTSAPVKYGWASIRFAVKFGQIET